METIDQKEVEAMAYLLERWFGFDQFAMIRAYQTDSTNVIDDVHHGYLVHYDIKDAPNDFKEKAFVNAEDAAAFYIQYKNENKLS